MAQNSEYLVPNAPDDSDHISGKQSELKTINNTMSSLLMYYMSVGGMYNYSVY
jgi:hypothetical protein